MEFVFNYGVWGIENEEGKEVEYIKCVRWRWLEGVGKEGKGIEGGGRLLF